MTTRLRRSADPTCLLLAATACLPLTVTACGGERADREAGPPEPVVIESPRTRVVVGADTLLVFGPSIFTYMGVGADGARPSAAVLESAQAFQAGIQEALRTLMALGVRVEAITEPPTVLDAPAQADAAAGPRLDGASYGYLFVDAVGHMRRVTSRLGAAELVCTAAGTFGLTLDAQQGAACR